jgi:FAD:protein FMN transferase
MHFVEAWALALAFLSVESSPLVHKQQYCMGTMFEVLVYHGSRPGAERAIDQVMAEMVRLDRVMSHYKSDSNLAKLVRDAHNTFVQVDPDLYEVLRESIAVSRRSAGRFDVTVAPLVHMWREAEAEGRRPSEAQIAALAPCVGYEKIDIEPPDRIRLRSDCLEIDLGGIGKGYAVDRAIAILKSAGIQQALVNAGGSSMSAIGAPPGQDGWPVRLGGGESARELLLRNSSLSTSEQNGEIIDPQTASPTTSNMTITVSAPSATLADALSTTLLLMSAGERATLLEQYAGVTVVNLSDAR